MKSSKFTTVVDPSFSDFRHDRAISRDQKMNMAHTLSILELEDEFRSKLKIQAFIILFELIKMVFFFHKTPNYCTHLKKMLEILPKSVAAAPSPGSILYHPGGEGWSWG